MANENSIQEEIKEIVDLCNQLKLEYKSYFNPPATEEEIREWEKTNGITIPESYKEWLRFSNGSQILEESACFYGIEKIELHDPTFSKDLVVIGELIGDGDRICFSKSTGKFLRHSHGKVREYDNFKVILNKFMDTI